MAVVSATIPSPLADRVSAALDWYNATQPERFEVTGIVDADASMMAVEPRELRLVLCGGDQCRRENFLVASAGGGFDVALADAGPAVAGRVQSELDPPPGARRNWLDDVLARHHFTLILFYRGFW